MAKGRVVVKRPCVSARGIDSDVGAAVILAPIGAKPATVRLLA